VNKLSNNITSRIPLLGYEENINNLSFLVEHKLCTKFEFFLYIELITKLENQIYMTIFNEN